MYFLQHPIKKPNVYFTDGKSPEPCSAVISFFYVTKNLRKIRRYTRSMNDTKYRSPAVSRLLPRVMYDLMSSTFDRLTYYRCSLYGLSDSLSPLYLAYVYVLLASFLVKALSDVCLGY